jgi:nitrilase
MRVVRAAAVQMSPVLYSREATVEKVVRKIHELGPAGGAVRHVPGDRGPLLPVLSPSGSYQRKRVAPQAKPVPKAAVRIRSPSRIRPSVEAS